MNVSQLDQMSPTKRRLLSNFISLSVLQGANYVLPLITLPYLVRVLGPEKYGLVSFAQAFIQYFAILTDYGFNLSAVRAIAINRDDSDKLSKIFSSVMSVKFVLLISSFIIMSIIVFSFEKFSKEWALYFLTFGSVLGQLMFPIWFFQGIERMKYITYLNLTARLLFTVLIFVFVRDVSDYIYVPVLNFLGALIAGLWALKIVFKDFKIHFKIPASADFMHQLKEGWPVFISQVAISGYTASRLFAVGLFTNEATTGCYAVAEKLMNVIQTFPLASLLQTLYPRLSKIYSENKERAFSLMVKFQRFTTLGYIVVLPIIYWAAPAIVAIVAGKAYSETILAFRLLLPAVFFINANTFRVHFLLISGKDDLYLKIHTFMGLAGCILTFISAYFFSFIGASLSIGIIAFIVLVLTLKFS